jgi:hypothetical protein
VRHLSHALGVATLILLVNCEYVVFRNANARMHSSAPLAQVALVDVFAIAILSTVLALILIALHRTRRWPLLEFVLAACLPPLLIARNAELVSWPPHPYRLFLKIPGIASWQWPPSRARVIVLMFCWMLLLLTVRSCALPAYQRLVRYGSAILAGCGLFGIVVSAQLVRAATWSPRPAQPVIAERATGKAFGHHRRVVWIILDELSHRQVFEHRAQGLELPHFDSLRSVSTVYTQVLDAGSRTETVMPSLFLGTRVVDVDYSDSDHLVVRRESGAWESFDLHRTTFAEAFQTGRRIGIAGWWNPYCQMSEGLASECFWTARVPPNNPFNPPSKAETAAIQIHHETYDELHARNVRLLKDESLDFVFLHLPVPHPPSIYDRRAATFRLGYGGSYLDSLALADRTLGECLSILRASPRWSETTLIVNGDHSWRIDSWRRAPGWTAEDEMASGNKFDPRPALLVHQPGQLEPVTVNSPFPLIHLHKILTDALIP